VERIAKKLGVFFLVVSIILFCFPSTTAEDIDPSKPYHTWDDIKERPFVYDNGNLGIGTETPLFPLDIFGTDYSEIRVHSGDPTGYARVWYSLEDGVDPGEKWNVGVRGDGNNNFAFETNTGPGSFVQRMVITKDGDVGIGTSTPHPNAMLHVYSPSTDAPHAVAIIHEENTAQSAGVGAVLGGDDFWDPNRIWFSGVRADIHTNNQEKFAILYGEESDATKLVIEKDGNVGIGTDSPSFELDIAPNQPNQRVTLQIKGQGTHPTDHEQKGEAEIRMVTDNGQWVLNTDDETGNLRLFGYGNPWPTVMRIEKDAPEHSLMIDSAGNIGIGTDSPVEALHIKRSESTNYASSGTSDFPLGGAILRVENADSGDDNWGGIRLQVPNDGGTGNLAYIGAVSTSSHTPHIVFGQRTGASAYAERMRIDSSGNVGIGTTDPRTMLEISGTGGAAEGTNNVRLRLTTTGSVDAAPGIELQNVDNDGGNIISKMIARDTSAFSFEYSAPDVNHHVSGESLMVINTDGNVGIGTDTPQKKLHVAGDSIKLGDGGGGFATWFDASGFADFKVSSTQVMRLQSNGKVGIGTTTPQAKLHVAGTIMAESFVDSSGNAITGGGGGPSTSSNNYFLAFTSSVKGTGENPFVLTGQTGHEGTHTILFDEVTDPSNSYDPSTGIFTASVAGPYYFHTSLTIDGGQGGDDSINLSFSKNNQQVNNLWINPQYTTRPGVEETHSLGTIIQLSQGDEVKVSVTNINAGQTTRIQSRNFLGYHLAAGGTGTGGSGAGWQTVPLTDTNPFEVDCEYRFKPTLSGTTTPADAWNYADGVSPGFTLFYIYADLKGVIQHDDKAYWDRRSSDNINVVVDDQWGNVAEIQKRCGGVGGTSPGTNQGGTGPSITNIAIGGMATASTEYTGANNVAQNAFDNDLVSGWGNNNQMPSYLEYDFGAGNLRVVNAYKMYISSDQPGGWGDERYNPMAWEFQAWDGSTWRQLHAINQNILTMDQWYTFDTQNTDPYQKYRIFITASEDTDWTHISELQLIGPASQVNNVGATRHNFETGQIEFDAWSGSEYQCKLVRFNRAFENVPKVIITVNHPRYGRFSGAHDPMTAWIEKIGRTMFRVCVRDVNDDSPGHNTVTVDYLATDNNGPLPLQPNVDVGRVAFASYSTPAIQCQNINFNSAFSQTPRVFATTNHQNSGSLAGRHDPMTEWIEAIDTSRFRICVRDVKDSAPAHDALKVDYIAVQGNGATTPDTTIDIGRVNFASYSTPATQCKNINFNKDFLGVPKVYTTVNHPAAGFGSTHDAMTSWVELIGRDKFRVCVRDLNDASPSHAALAVDWMAVETLSTPKTIVVGSGATSNTFSGITIADVITQTYNGGSDLYSIGLRRSGASGNIGSPDLYGKDTDGVLVLAGDASGGGKVKISGDLQVNGKISGKAERITSRLARYHTTCSELAGGRYNQVAVAVPATSTTSTTGNALCENMVSQNSQTDWKCLDVPYVYNGNRYDDNHYSTDVRPYWGTCTQTYPAGSYKWFNPDTGEGVMMACCAKSPHRPSRPFNKDDVDAQILAEATCTAMNTKSGWTFAVRRPCITGSQTTCAHICNGLSESQAGQLECFNSLHIYGRQPASSTSTIGLKTYRYNNCFHTSCGPNYCCCRQT